MAISLDKRELNWAVHKMTSGSAFFVMVYLRIL